MKNKVFFVSCTEDYPALASANNTKIGLLAKGLCKQDQVVIINKYYGNRGAIRKTGRKDGVAYLSLSQKGSKFLVSWINLLVICRILYEKKASDRNNVIIIAGGSFFHYFFMCVYSRLIGFRRGMIFQEWHVSFKLGFIHNLNSYLFDRWLGHFVDMIFPISEYIMNRCKAFKKPMLKVPIVADFKSYRNEKSKIDTDSYFLYCASAGYFRIIQFILDSFKIFMEKKTGSETLKMVLSGNTDAVRKEIERLGLESRVEIFSNVSYGQLMQMYANAVGLLIPLDPASLQDVARFSQKIAEYLSSCRPVLTTAVGEIPYYFEDRKNAYIASDFTKEAYADLMQLVIENPEIADAVGKSGCELGRKEFDYLYITKQMCDFISQ